MKKTIKILYGTPEKVSHSSEEEYEKTEFYCFRCGKKGVWEGVCPGDYYLGQTWMCEYCGEDFTMQPGSHNNWQSQQRKEQLSS